MQNTNSFTVTEKISMLKLKQLNHNVLTMTLDDLSKELNVSTATINRTLKKMGYKNLKQYKLSISIPLQPTAIQPVSALEEKLVSLIYNFDKKALHSIVDEIYSANTVYIVAFGLSASVGLEISTNLSKLGKKTISINDSEVLSYISNDSLSRKDICIFISYLGEDQDMINFSILNKYNITQAIVTSTNDCTLAQSCHYTLTSNMSNSNDVFKSRISLNLITNKILELYKCKYYD